MSTRFSTPETLEGRRITVFLAAAFGVSWATALAIFLTGGLQDSLELAPGITLATVLLPTAYMFGPAIGNVAARLATGEGRANLMLRPNPRNALRTYAAAWFVPAGLVVVGGVLYFAVFPGQFDPTMAAFREQVGGSQDPWVVAIVQVVVAITIAPLLNTVVTFGEEFGWRAYLLPKLAPLGATRAVVLSGVVWGIWHWPILAMGYNYGFGYPGFPWTGMLAFLPFTVGTGTFLAWLTAREGSVWAASVGHAAINAIAAISLLFLVGEPNSLLGPAPVGLLAAVPWLLLAVWLLRDSSWFPGEAV